MSRREWLALVPGLLLASCSRRAAAPSAARQTALAYCQALRQRDWQRAHALLHPDSLAQCPLASFVALAEYQRGLLGFQPQEVVIRAWDETEEQALAHVVYRGQSEGRQRTFKDALTLKPAAERWGVLLSARSLREAAWLARRRAGR